MGLLGHLDTAPSFRSATARTMNLHHTVHNPLVDFITCKQHTFIKLFINDKYIYCVRMAPGAYIWCAVVYWVR